jgi:acyl-coenzyme A synthetase/AMP-(fatty) acid ligase
MTPADSTPTTLPGLLDAIPAEATALVQPEQGLRLTYGELRDQVRDVARALAAAGVKRGDRIGIALPNGIPNVVTFLAASLAGTAAPLNPGYKEEEFRFYLEDTNARVLLLPPEGLDDARRAAGDRVPILAVDMDAQGRVTLSGATDRAEPEPAGVGDVPRFLHTSGSTGPPKRVPRGHANQSI